MNKKMHYGQALNLDQLRFEELGRSPITRMNELRRDTAEQPFSAHFLTCTRKGDRRDRELHSGGFEEYLI
ncbi:MAG: hypothetical protein U0903_04570 [Planctomycetales bacterium]